MSINVFKECLESLPNLAYIELQGEGEPLLCPDFFEMVSISKKRNINISTITNGSLLTDRNIERILSSGLDNLSVSIETADKERFKSIRGGNLEDIILGIRNLVAAKKVHKTAYPHISFSVTILKEELDGLSKIFELYEKLDMDGGIIIQFLNESKDYEKHYDEKIRNNMITQSERKSIYHKYYKFMIKNKLVDKEEGHFFSLLQSSGNEIKKSKLCNWLKCGLYLRVDGAVAPCVYSKIYSFGKLSKGIKDIAEKRSDMIGAWEAGNIPQVCRDIHCGVFSL
jgi:MoaA/NifB/PqqE/SkfB family radical SAM enzyme